MKEDAEALEDAFAGIVCRVRSDGPAVHVAPEGELDLATVDELGRRLAAVRAAGADRLVLDLRRLTFMDLAGCAWSRSGARGRHGKDSASRSCPAPRVCGVSSS